MTVFLMIFVPIIFVLSLYVTHNYSYLIGYENGRKDERKNALVSDPFFHGLVLDSIRENLGEDEIR